MTAIKPPGIDLPTVPHSPHVGETAGQNAATNATSGSDPAASTGSAFAQELGRAQQLAGQAPVGGAADPIGLLASELQAGKISMDQALDTLVERAVGGLGHRLGAQE